MILVATMGSEWLSCLTDDAQCQRRRATQSRTQGASELGDQTGTQILSTPVFPNLCLMEGSPEPIRGNWEKPGQGQRCHLQLGVEVILLSHEVLVLSLPLLQISCQTGILIPECIEFLGLCCLDLG